MIYEQQPRSAGPDGRARGSLFVKETLVTCASVLLALAARKMLEQRLGPQLPFAFFLAAVVVSAWYGRFPQSLLAAAAGFFLGEYFNEAGDPFAWQHYGPRQAAFALNSGIIIILSESMHRARQRASRFARELHTVLSSISEAVIVSDQRGRIVYLNKSAENLTGFKSGEAKGEPLTDILKFNNDRRGAADEEIAHDFKADEIFSHSTRVSMVSRQGAVIPIQKSASPLIDETGAPRGMVLVIQGPLPSSREADRSMTTG